MGVKDLREKSIEELHQLIKDLRRELASGVINEKARSEDSTYLRKKRKDLARALTVLGEKKILESIKL